MEGRKGNLKRNFILVLTLLILGGLGHQASPAWDQKGLQDRIAVIAPASGEKKIEIFQADKEIYAVVVKYQGPALPGRNSIMLEFTPPEVKKAHASYFQGGPMLFPFQTAPVWVNSLGQIPGQTQFALWQEKNGQWGCMIALVGGGLRTYLHGDGKKVVATADSLDPEFAPSIVPIFAIGWGDDPYQLIDDIYAFGMKVMKDLDPKGVIGNLRRDKKFPEIWGYLGWCSWNAYYRWVDQKDLYANAESFKKAGVPVRWILIDDCWSTVNPRQTLSPWSPGKLTGLEADPEKFPGGLKQTVKTLKEDYGFSWVGVWHTFEGYWSGIQIDSEVGKKYGDYLFPISEKVAVPDPSSDKGEKFWDAWYKFMADSGVDFVKVDNQGALGWMTEGKLPVSFVQAQAHQNLEGPAEKYFNLNVMNCMEQNIETIYQWEKTNLGRAAVDYTPISYTNPRNNCWLNVMNSLWFTQLLWPDYDMWMSHDGHPEYYTVEHAISGGPIYTTDKPGKEKFEYYWPLILSDGLVIRPDQPALPTRKCLLNDPRTDLIPLSAFAPAGEAGMLAVWNVDKFFRPVKAELAPSDVEGIEGEKFAIYEYFSGKLLVKGRNENFSEKLKGWEVKLYSVVPVKDGFAPIGLVNKYISPATISQVKREPGKVTVELKEPGTFAAYCERKPKQVKRDGAVLSEQLIEYSNNLLKIKMAGLIDGRPRAQLEFIW